MNPQPELIRDFADLLGVPAEELFRELGWLPAEPMPLRD
jgi:hypothetical protein